MNVMFYDETPGLRREEGFRLETGGHTITAAALIRTRVELEAERLVADAQDRKQAALQPMGRCLVGRVRSGVGAGTPNVEAMVATALEAFRQGGFFLFANDRQIESLDEEIALGDTVDVTFLRLVALQGG